MINFNKAPRCESQILKIFKQFQTQQQHRGLLLKQTECVKTPSFLSQHYVVEGITRGGGENPAGVGRQAERNGTRYESRARAGEE